MAQAKPKPTTDDSTEDFDAEFIVEAKLIKALAEGVNTLGTYDEGVLSFGEDGVRMAIADGANALLLDQFIPADAFESYDIGDYRFGVDTGTLENLAGMVSPGTPIHFGLDEMRAVFEVQADDVDYTLAGINPDDVNGLLKEDPDLDLAIEATVPVDKIKRGAKLVEMSTGSNYAEFHAGEGVFKMVGNGDTDTTSLDFDTDGFEFDTDPRTIHEARYSPDYLKEIPKVLDESTVDFAYQTDMPLRILTTREDVIDTRIILAPRIDSS